MILAYLMAALAGVAVYLLTFRLHAGYRVMLTLLVFAVPSVIITVWVMAVGDRAPPDAVTVTPDGKVAPASEEKEP